MIQTAKQFQEEKSNIVTVHTSDTCEHTTEIKETLMATVLVSLYEKEIFLGE